MAAQSLRIGWSSADITPPGPVYLRGQFRARISNQVLDPLTTTALAISSPAGDAQLVMVSVDRVSIEDAVMAECRARFREIEGLDAEAVVISATHTHTAPEGESRRRVPPPSPVADGDEYRPQLVDGIVQAVSEAWAGRAPGSFGYGLGHAVIGVNRRTMYLSGEARMYGPVDDPQFAGFEGADDPSIDLLYTFSPTGDLTGVLVNVACPSQVTEGDLFVSADFWHETRVELRRRLGDGLYVLPQCSPAGDLSPHPLLRKPAEARMRSLKGGVSERQEIALRLADVVEQVLPWAASARQDEAELRSEVVKLGLPRRTVTPEEREEARAGQAADLATYERLLRDDPGNYAAITHAFHHAEWFARVEERCLEEQTQPEYPVVLHLARLGDIAFATNPFELFLDYGLRIEARSPAVQTFCVQLAGRGTYLPTARAVAAKSYGAGAPSNVVGPEGGQVLVEATVAGLQRLFD